jgi:hypothetical protein
MTLRLVVYSGNTRSLGESLHLSGLSSIGALIELPLLVLAKELESDGRT